MGFFLFVLVFYHEEARAICFAYPIVIPEIAFRKLFAQLGLIGITAFASRSGYVEWLSAAEHAWDNTGTSFCFSCHKFVSNTKDEFPLLSY